MQKLVLCLSCNDFCNKIKESDYMVYTTIEELQYEKPNIIFCDEKKYAKNKSSLTELLYTTPSIIINTTGIKTFDIFTCQISKDADISLINATIQWSIEKFSYIQRISALSKTDPNSFSSMMSKMSHHVRTPLNGIIGMTDLLNETSLSRTQQSYLKTIRESGRVLMQLMNDILEYSRLNDHLITKTQKPFNLFNCIEESIDAVIGLIFEKQIYFTYYLSPELPYNIIDDENKIRKALYILLQYIIQNSKRGDLSLKIIPYKNEGSKYDIKFSITCSKCIIPVNTNIKTLINPFDNIFFGEEKVTPGLSLSICNKLLEILGSSLKLNINDKQIISAEFTLQSTKNTNVQDPEFLKKAPPSLANKNLVLISDSLKPYPKITNFSYLWGMKIQRIYSELKNTDWIRKLQKHDILIIDFSKTRLNELETIDKIREGTQKPLVLLRNMKDTNEFFKVIQKNSVILYKPLDALTLFNTFKNIIINDANRLRRIKIQTHSDISHNSIDPSLRILVAEDDKTNKKVINRILNKLGYTATIVSDGQKAINEVEKSQYDVILMDIQMPIMNGLEATKIIRQKLSEKNQPTIIAITADNPKDDDPTYKDAGLDSYLPKPIQMQKLLQVLNRCKRIQ